MKQALLDRIRMKTIANRGKHPMRSLHLWFTVVTAPSLAFGLGCIEHLALPKYPTLMRAARLSADVHCSSNFSPAGSESKFQCIASDKRFSAVAERMERETKPAEECRLTGAKFRLRFVVTPDVKQDAESYVIDKEGVVISIGPREVSW